jgi:hypothetical protein
MQEKLYVFFCFFTTRRVLKQQVKHKIANITHTQLKQGGVFG